MRTVCIGDLGEIVTGTTPPSKEQELYGNDVPFLTPTDMPLDRRHVSPARALSALGASRFKSRIVPSRSIAVACIGSIGKVCITERPTLTNQQINTIVVDDSQHCPEYVYFLVRTMEERLKSVAGGAATPIVNKAVFSSLEVDVPSFATQRHVAATLGSFEDLIENNRRRIEILEQMARLIYRECFVHFRFPGQEDVELVDSELGPIPEGWEVAAFSDLAEFVNGFAFKSSEHWMDEGLPIVKIKELKNGVTADTPRYHGEDINEKYFVDDGDVLFSWSADLDAYVWSGGPALLNQHLFVVRPFELSDLFLFHSLRGRMAEFRARSQGTTMKHIKRSALSEVRTVVPDEKVRLLFEETVAPMLELQLNLTSQNRALTESRDLLLPRLISGELDVSDLDLDLDSVA